MVLWSSLIAVLGFSLAAVSLSAQEKPAFEITKLADHVYKLTVDGGGYPVKVIASTGEDGLLIVDAAKEKTGEELKAALKSISKAQPDIIISSHSHMEHVGGNMTFDNRPLIIGHPALRKKLRSGAFLFDEFSDQTVPQLTFSDSLSLFYNGEEIKVLSFAGAHDNCDIVVWFTKSKVVYVAGLSAGRHFPTVDEDGDVLIYPKQVKRLLNILPDDVIIIPGHGEDGNKTDLQAFYDMLVETEAIVRSELAKGKDLATLQQEDVLKKYEPFESAFTSRNDWVACLVGGILPESTTKPKTLYEPMYYALRDGGPDSAVALYWQLKNKERDKYLFDEPTIVDIAFRLYEKKKYTESIPFFQLAVKEYPAGEYASRVYRLLGMSYRQLGDTAQAIKNFKECLKMNPKDTRAADAAKELEGK